VFTISYKLLQWPLGSFLIVITDATTLLSVGTAESPRVTSSDSKSPQIGRWN